MTPPKSTSRSRFRFTPLLAALFATGVFAQASPFAGLDIPVPPTAERPAGLSPDLFYRILLGDVALQRGDAVLAARAYFEAAREAQDARLARRAAEIALATRQRGVAEASAKLWAELEPGAERPRQILATLAAAPSGRDNAAPVERGDDELKARLEKLLADAALTGGGVGEVFLALGDGDLGVGDLLFEFFDRQSSEGAEVGVVFFLLVGGRAPLRVTAKRG